MRFTIRELMLLTLGIALGTGWWMHHRHEVALRLRLEEELAAERAEKQRMLSFSQEIVARLRRADPRFDKSSRTQESLLGAAPDSKRDAARYLSDARYAIKSANS